MSKGRFKKLHQVLTPQERFELYIEAVAREDEAEMRLLARSAPRDTYTQTDAAFTGLIRASSEITELVCSSVLQQMAKVRMLVGVSSVLLATQGTVLGEAHLACLDAYAAGARAAWRIAGKEDDPPCVEKEAGDRQLKAVLEGLEQQGVSGAADKVEETLKRRRFEIGVEAREMWEAFGNFSRNELEVEPKELVQVWFEPALAEIEELEFLTEGIELDQKHVAEKETSLKRICSSRLVA